MHDYITIPAINRHINYTTDDRSSIWSKEGLDQRGVRDTGDLGERPSSKLIMYLAIAPMLLLDGCPLTLALIQLVLDTCAFVWKLGQ